MQHSSFLVSPQGLFHTYSSKTRKRLGLEMRKKLKQGSKILAHVRPASRSTHLLKNHQEVNQLAMKVTNDCYFVCCP